MRFMLYRSITACRFACSLQLVTEHAELVATVHGVNE
jgi:hypothetical protein